MKLRLVLCLILFGAALLVSQALRAPVIAQSKHDVKFYGAGCDNGCDPRLPKDWKLVSVAQATASNEYTLWFQDEGGVIYLVHGRYTSAGTYMHFSMYPDIGKIERK